MLRDYMDLGKIRLNYNRAVYNLYNHNNCPRGGNNVNPGQDLPIRVG